jgi:hypothetical protein
VTKASPYRIREALAGRSQLEAVAVALEESKPGFALDRRRGRSGAEEIVAMSSYQNYIDFLQNL